MKKTYRWSGAQVGATWIERAKKELLVEGEGGLWEGILHSEVWSVG